VPSAKKVMNNLPVKLVYFVLAALVIVVSGLSFAVFNLFQIASTPPAPVVERVVTDSGQVVEKTVDVCGESCKEEIEKAVSAAVATISGSKSTETIIKEVSTSGGTDFISLGSTATTTDTDWKTIDDTAVYIDLVNDYSADAYVTWEASLKVAHANGQAFARLWDDTNKIGVSGSEISTINNSDYVQKVSTNLALWRGRNLYKVQIKSLNGFLVTYSGGRIKIVD